MLDLAAVLNEVGGRSRQVTDADPEAAAGDYLAFIDSGKQVAVGTITADPQVAGQFDVSGTIALADLGSFPVTIHIMDQGGASTAVNSTVVVSVGRGALPAELDRSKGGGGWKEHRQRDLDREK